MATRVIRSKSKSKCKPKSKSKQKSLAVQPRRRATRGLPPRPDGTPRDGTE